MKGIQTQATSLDALPLRIAKRCMLVILGPLYFAFVAIVPVFCSKRPGFRGWYWRTVKRACSRLLWLLSIRVQISQEDRAELADDVGSVIVINHRSHLDGFALMDAVPDEKWFTFAAKKELFGSRLLKTGFTGAGLVEIDRNSGKVAMDTLSKAVREMALRRSVVLFPEGTRSNSEYLGPFKAGAVVVARETGRTIRPIVIMDADELLPRGRFMPRGGTIRIKVLPSFHCDPGASVDEDVARLHTEMLSVLKNG